MPRKCRVATLALLVLTSGTAVGQEVDFIFVESPALFPTLVQLPENFDQAKSYPLIVSLHGFGGTPEHLVAAGQKLPSAGFILASVQAPYPFLIDEGDLRFDWNLSRFRQQALTSRATRLSIDYILASLSGLQSSFNVTRAYLLGFSQGGAFTYRTGVLNPTAFDGIIAIGSGFNPDWLSRDQLVAASGLPVFIAHGEADDRVPLERGTRARDTLSALGYDVTFRSYEAGHEVTDEMIDAVVEWVSGR